MTATKTDNSDPSAKLELRRYFLRKYHAEEAPQVLDCCQGQGVLWKRLRREFELASYWGLDIKPRKGRLKLDSVRVLSQPGWPQNVVDVDTYGSPWKHWEALLGNLRRPTTVFLTVGLVYLGIDRAELHSLGLGGMMIPPGIGRKLHEIAVSTLLTRGCVYDNLTIEIVEAVSTGSARYFGVRLEPGNHAGDRNPVRPT